ncbi:MAG: hypothetical protein PHY64_12530 [Eubacteriales bacterium]|nr:hypothetical protein [Eubacteriales bacterium]
MEPKKRAALSANLCNASMLAYMTWLLLPTVQAGLHAVTGALTIAVFGAGVLLDGETLPKRWKSFLPRVLMAAMLPLILLLFLERGGGQTAGYLAQQGMFWFPLLWCAYAREREDGRLYRFVKPLFLLLLIVTTCTTIGWLVQGMLRGDRVYAYSRSLGYGGPNREAYLRELMLRNIGGYDFIYASVLLLPVTFYYLLVSHGWKKAAFITAYCLQLAMIGLSQYTYAILFALAVTGVELFALLLRAIFKKLSVGASLWITLPVFAALWLLRVPLVNWAASLAAGFGFENAAYSLNQLLTLLSGGAVDAGSRLDAYALALNGFAASPLVGSIFSGVKSLGMHSDLLDLLSGLGLVGTAAFALGAWIIGRGSMKGVQKSPAYPHILLQGAVLLACLLLGTVFYSREIPLVVCLSVTLLLPRKETGAISQ